MRIILFTFSILFSIQTYGLSCQQNFLLNVISLDTFRESPISRIVGPQAAPIELTEEEAAIYFFNPNGNGDEFSQESVQVEEKPFAQGHFSNILLRKDIGSRRVIDSSLALANSFIEDLQVIENAFNNDADEARFVYFPNSESMLSLDRIHLFLILPQVGAYLERNPEDLGNDKQRDLWQKLSQLRVRFQRVSSIVYETDFFRINSTETNRELSANEATAELDLILGSLELMNLGSGIFKIYSKDPYWMYRLNLVRLSVLEGLIGRYASVIQLRRVPGRPINSIDLIVTHRIRSALLPFRDYYSRYLNGIRRNIFRPIFRNYVARQQAIVDEINRWEEFFDGP